jgi:hypothetical protein
MQRDGSATRAASPPCVLHLGSGLRGMTASGVSRWRVSDSARPVES